MRVLILGASGLIGSAVATRLAAEGHEVVALSRRASNAASARSLDVANASTEDWRTTLAGIDAVVNCIGILQRTGSDSPSQVHDAAVASLVTACERAGVKRLVHLSAAGVEAGLSEFSRSKLRGDRRIIASSLDWVILRPSVVVGRAAYGGSALLRGLAALPIFPVPPNAGPLQLVWLDDVVETIARLLREGAPTRQIFELVGPTRYSFADAVALVRRWLGRRPAYRFALPHWLARAMFGLGDVAGWLGWRPPLRSNAELEMSQGAIGDSSAWTSATGIQPSSIESALNNSPATVQERWFSTLYILKPLVFGIFGLFWLATGLVSFGPGWDIGKTLLKEGGVDDRLSDLLIAAGASADVVIGLAILYRPLARYGLYAALAISLAYAVIGTILVPRLWEDPLGPMLKIWPIIVLNLVALAILEDR